MARSDLLVSLVRAGAAGDRSSMTSTVEAIVAEERARSHHILADRLRDVGCGGNLRYYRGGRGCGVGVRVGVGVGSLAACHGVLAVALDIGIPPLNCRSYSIV